MTRKRFRCDIVSAVYHFSLPFVPKCEMACGRSGNKLGRITERQDHLLRQVDQLAAVLQRLLADLVNVPIDNATVDRTMEQLNEAMALDPTVQSSGSPQMIQGLLSNPAFSFTNAELIADLYRAMADGLVDTEITHGRALQLRQHALAILEYLHANDTAYSFTRQGKIAALRGQL